MQSLFHTSVHSELLDLSFIIIIGFYVAFRSFLNPGEGKYGYVCKPNVVLFFLFVFAK